MLLYRVLNVSWTKPNQEGKSVITFCVSPAMKKPSSLEVMRPLAAQTTRDRTPGWYHPLLLRHVANFVASKGTWSSWSRFKMVERTQQFLLRLDCKDFLLKVYEFVFRRKKMYLRSRIFRRRLSIVAKIGGGGGGGAKGNTSGNNVTNFHCYVFFF